MKISFFKTARPKVFSYRPLYYDERKEELEKIKNAVSESQEGDVLQKAKVNIHRSWQQRRDRQQRTRTSSLRLLIYLLFLLLALYFMFFAKIF